MFITNEILVLFCKLVFLPTISSFCCQIDAENLKRCVNFASYHVCYGKYSIPNKSETRRLLETFSTKYDYLGYSYYADELSNCVRNYSTTGPKEKQEDVS